MKVVMMDWSSSKETLGRLTKGLRLLEILKQFPGSPINVRRQIGILSLAGSEGRVLRGPIQLIQYSCFFICISQYLCGLYYLFQQD